MAYLVPERAGNRRHWRCARGGSVAAADGGSEVSPGRELTGRPEAGDVADLGKQLQRVGRHLAEEGVRLLADLEEARELGRNLGSRAYGPA